MSKEPVQMEQIVSLCKRRGFIFQSSEIYGGYNGFWDYGPYGVRMKRAIEQLWWNYMVDTRTNVEGLDSTVICHPKVWKASGHIDQFSDEMTDCKDCKNRHRVDQMEDPTTCPACGSKNLTEPREFNLMMKTIIGALGTDDDAAYLRPETAQGIFVNFKNVVDSSRVKLPFGICQVGKSFRNEITPRNFTFRSREFEQMEIEFFCRPDDSPGWYTYWRDRRYQWYQELGISSDRLILRDHHTEELAHYSVGTADIEYAFPFLDDGEFGELEGIAHRGDFDLRSHMDGKLAKNAAGELEVELNEHGQPKYRGSGKDLSYFDDQAKGILQEVIHLIQCSYDEPANNTALQNQTLLAAYQVEVVSRPFLCELSGYQ